MNETTYCRISEVNKLSDDVSSFKFQSQGQPFTGLEPGAHIDVHLSGNMVRQYSMFAWSEDSMSLTVAVKREESGRGGSLQMHQLRVGDGLEIGGPRNNFNLEQTDCHYTLIAGGIGVTPIYAMASRLKEIGADFRIYYLVQTQAMAAFDTLFQTLEIGDNYHLHCDDENGLFDLKEVLTQEPAGGEIYVCGPEPMLNAVLESSSALRSGNIHFERFSTTDDLEHDPNQAFDVEIKSSGAVFAIGKDENILNVLQDNNIDVDFGCSEGLCGACIVDVLEGEVDHRDSILTPEEQEQNEMMCVCVSRAKSKRLVLDL